MSLFKRLIGVLLQIVLLPLVALSWLGFTGWARRSDRRRLLRDRRRHPEDFVPLPPLRIRRVSRATALRLLDPQAQPDRLRFGVPLIVGRRWERDALIQNRKAAHRMSTHRWHLRKILNAAHAMDVPSWAEGRMQRYADPVVAMLGEAGRSDVGQQERQQQAEPLMSLQQRRELAIAVLSRLPLPAQRLDRSLPDVLALLEPGVARLHVAFVPVDPAQPWQIPAYLAYGDLYAEPLIPTHTAVAGRWFALYGARPLVLGQQRAVWWVERPPTTPQQAVDLAIEHLAYCPQVSIHRLSAYAHKVLGAKAWVFRWS